MVLHTRCSMHHCVVKQPAATVIAVWSWLQTAPAGPSASRCLQCGLFFVPCFVAAAGITWMLAVRQALRVNGICQIFYLYRQCV